MRSSSGGSGGVIVCLGVGGLVDLEEHFGLDDDAGVEDVEIWLLDARRPWHLANVFGGQPRSSNEQDVNVLVTSSAGVEQGRILQSYRAGRGGIIAFDDGDIEAELTDEKEAFCGLAAMPELGEWFEDPALDQERVEESEDEVIPDSAQTGRKRKSWSDREEEESESEVDEDRPAQRRRSNSVRDDVASTSHTADDL